MQMVDPKDVRRHFSSILEPARSSLRSDQELEKKEGWRRGLHLRVRNITVDSSRQLARPTDCSFQVK